MSKADYETWIGRKGRRHGKPYAERRALVVPWHVATGNYERLSELQLRELENDIAAERERRGSSAATPQPTPYDPSASQIRRPA